MEENNQLINKVIDLLFAKNNVKYLILLFIIAFILRAIIASNIAPNADEMLHAPHAINFIDSGKLQIMDEDPIWFFLTDLSYKIFGINMFAARFLAVLFGSLSVIVLYSIIKKIYNKSIALISSMILTFSSFHMLMSLAEMDVAMTFFVLLSLYFLIKALKEKNEKYLPVSYLFLGIAILVKQIAIAFIPALVIFYICYKLKNKEKIQAKQILIFILVLFVVSLPTLTFNYLLYKDKGLVDLQFSRFLGIAKETYKPIEATIQPFSFERLFFSSNNQKPGFIDGITFFWNFDKLIFILGILGVIVALLTKKEFLSLWLLSFLFPFLFLAGTSLLEYHFIFGVPILSLFGAIFIDFFSEKISKLKIKKNIIITIFVLIIVIYNVSFVTARGIFNRSEVTKMMSYSKDNIEDDALVIPDSRIYRGRIVWMFNDKHYLEASSFPNLVNQLDNLPGNPKTIKTYFIECITDDCGWGTINSQPEFNSSMEDISKFFKNESGSLTTITSKDNEPYFSIYSKSLILKDSVLNVADATHEWFYYPLGYEPKEKIFDNYNANGFNKFLDLIAHLILYTEILIALSSIILIFYILVKDERLE
jgi:hypothetical protein